MCESKKVSIIISTLNCLPLTRELLFSLEAAKPTIPYEVIIVDNASTDGTRGFLATLGQPYRVILRNERCSYAVNNNYGARIAQGEFLALLNNDLILTQSWLDPMLKLHQDYDRVGAVGNIQFYPQTSLIDHAGVTFDLDGIPFHIRKNRKRLPSGLYRECNAITGACMLIKREVFLGIDGFNEDYKNGSEDIDLCVRLRLAKYRILVSHQSQIYHQVSSSPGRFDHVDANMNLFLNKWRSLTSSWGQHEWAAEYFHRYARQFWKMTPPKACKALWLLGKNRFGNDAKVYRQSL